MENKRKLETESVDNSKPLKMMKLDPCVDAAKEQSLTGDRKERGCVNPVKTRPWSEGCVRISDRQSVGLKEHNQQTAPKRAIKPGVNFHSIAELSEPAAPQTEILRPLSADLCQGRDSVSPADSNISDNPVENIVSLAAPITFAPAEVGNGPVMSASCMPGALVRPQAIRLQSLPSQTLPQQQQQQQQQQLQQQHLQHQQQQLQHQQQHIHSPHFPLQQTVHLPQNIKQEHFSKSQIVFPEASQHGVPNVTTCSKDLEDAVSKQALQSVKQTKGRPRKQATAKPTTTSTTKPATTQGEDGSTQGGKKGRTTYKALQIQVLEDVFTRAQYPDSAEIHRLAKEMGISKTQVKVWFQNKRARWRRRVTETTPLQPLPCLGNVSHHTWSTQGAVSPGSVNIGPTAATTAAAAAAAAGSIPEKMGFQSSFPLAVQPGPFSPAGFPPTTFTPMFSVPGLFNSNFTHNTPVVTQTHTKKPSAQRH